MGNSIDKEDGVERREHQRVDQRLRIDFKIDSDGKTIQGETYNLSPAGVYCRVDNPIAEMTQLMIMLDLPTGQVTCEGTVVRAEQGSPSEETYHLAIFFHKISEEAARHLDGFLMG